MNSQRLLLPAPRVAENRLPALPPRFRFQRFSLVEDRELVIARLALVHRQPLSDSELDASAELRRRQAIPRWRMRQLLSSSLLAFASAGLYLSGVLLDRALLIAIGMGSILPAVALAIHALLPPLETFHPSALVPFYQPGEQVAGPEGIAALSHIAAMDPEVAAIVATWWNDSAPIRMRDIDLVLAFRDAKQKR